MLLNCSNVNLLGLQLHVYLDITCTKFVPGIKFFISLIRAIFLAASKPVNLTENSVFSLTGATSSSSCS